MLSFQKLLSIPTENKRIIASGHYFAPLTHAQVKIANAVSSMSNNTKLYTPSELEMLVARLDEPLEKLSTQISVTNQSTADAILELYREDPKSQILALNFASALNPGGGYEEGAESQEEDLCRKSALSHSLISEQVKKYYLINHNVRSSLYTDHAIYSPNVPFFRDSALRLCDFLFFASILTMPAPDAANWSEDLTKPYDRKTFEETFLRRITMVLSVAREKECKNLVLGAWGCGVFGNNSEMVANCFKQVLDTPKFKGAFHKVVFAVLDDGLNSNIANFRRIFGGALIDSVYRS